MWEWGTREQSWAGGRLREALLPHGALPRGAPALRLPVRTSWGSGRGSSSLSIFPVSDRPSPTSPTPLLGPAPCSEPQEPPGQSVLMLNTCSPEVLPVARKPAPCTAGRLLGCVPPSSMTASPSVSALWMGKALTRRHFLFLTTGRLTSPVGRVAGDGFPCSPPLPHALTCPEAAFQPGPQDPCVFGPSTWQRVTHLVSSALMSQVWSKLAFPRIETSPLASRSLKCIFSLIQGSIMQLPQRRGCPTNPLDERSSCPPARCPPEPPGPAQRRRGPG